MCTILHRIVFEAVKQVPRGRVTTYKAIAEALGDPIAARTVARILSENGDPEDVPCYRVVMSDGSPGGYAFGGTAEKIRRLKKDDIEFVNGKIPLDRYIFRDFDIPPILEKMKKAQVEIATRNKREEIEFNVVIGVDVSYRDCRGFGVAVLFDKEGNHLDTSSWIGKIDFPYIPTYLAFREAKFMVGAIKGISEDALLLVDGQGIAHPRKAGEAVHVGAVLDLPSIGVAKRPLLRNQKSYRGAYVSPGWKIPPIDIIREIWFDGRKQPLPLEVAHRVATRMRQEST